MRIDVQVNGQDTAAQMLSRQGARAQAPQRALNVIAARLIALQRQRLSRGQGGLKRLAPSTLERKRRQHLDPRPLRATGTLIRSVTERGAPEQRLDISKDELVFGTKVYYARFHQFGEGNPRRRVLNLTPKQREPIAQIIADFLMGGRVG